MLHPLIKIIFYLFVLLFLTASSLLAREVTEEDCDFNFKGYEADIIKEISPSMIISQKSDWKDGEMQLRLTKFLEVTLTYGACFHVGASIKATHLNKEDMEVFLEFSQIIIGQAAPVMPDILKSLRPYLADVIIDLEIRGRYFSTMYINTTKNKDDTIDIKISVSGG